MSIKELNERVSAARGEVEARRRDALSGRIHVPPC